MARIINLFSLGLLFTYSFSFAQSVRPLAMCFSNDMHGQYRATVYEGLYGTFNVRFNDTNSNNPPTYEAALGIVTNKELALSFYEIKSIIDLIQIKNKKNDGKLIGKLYQRVTNDLSQSQMEFPKYWASVQMNCRIEQNL